MELSSGDDSGGERGLLHIWKGYSCSVTPERTLLSRPVLQVALGTYHGLLLVEGTLCSFIILGVKCLTFFISDFLGFLIDSSWKKLSIVTGILYLSIILGSFMPIFTPFSCFRNVYCYSFSSLKSRFVNLL